jgi:hypothetical protein
MSQLIYERGKSREWLLNAMMMMMMTENQQVNCMVL